MSGAGGVELDWDAVNTRHLKRPRVTPAEFEELINGDPVYVEYQAWSRYTRLAACRESIG